MGYSTEFVGHIEIDPPLNAAEQRYLKAFGGSRRMHRKSGPYVTGRDAGPDPDVIDSNKVTPGQPGLWCQWVPSCAGRCLIWDRGEKFYAPTEWMRYLIDHFLRPDALAATASARGFEKFTFDHSCNGEVAARREDTGRLWLIVVDDNKVSEQQRVAGISTDVVWGPGLDFIRPSPSGPAFDSAYQRATWPVSPNPGT